MGKSINSRTLFLTTSPRTPEKMIPEIDLLIKNFEGRLWNNDTQYSFMDILRNEQFFNGKGFKYPAFSARDRINRVPKSLGVISLSLKISLTPASKALLQTKRKSEIFLKQMLKFQIPSPYHIPSNKASFFCIKPYLELLRLIRTMGILKFDELQIFGMQLTDWHNFETIIEKIKKFRIDKLNYKGNYKKFKKEYITKELQKIFSERIIQGETKTRESNDTSLTKFIETQSHNMRDYADACFRYLRATELVNVSDVGKSLSIIKERIKDVDYILENCERTPKVFNNENEYILYLGDASLPYLLTDNKENLLNRIQTEFPYIAISKTFEVDKLKDILFTEIEKRKTETINLQIKEIKDYKQYNHIQTIYNQIIKNELYDNPLMLEWNIWRAMTMLDGGNIKANLNFDDFGKPLSTAQGNMPDIICNYDNFILSVEVTMSKGQKQYEMESEPISRHLGKLKQTYDKPCYCLFIAPEINQACIAHFYALHNINISYYGGNSVIIPLPLNIFQKMLEDSYQANYTPNENHVQKIFEYSKNIVKYCKDENEWYTKITSYAKNWLNINF